MIIFKRKKRYFLYSNSAVYSIVFGLGIMSVLYLATFIFLLHREIVNGLSGDDIICAILTIMPWIILLIVMSYYRMGARCLTRCRFDDIGIHCYYLLWGSFSLKWADIHTYGFFNSRAGYVSYDLVFLSKDPNELYDRKKLYNLSKERLIFAARPVFWEAFTEYMPKDMKKHLDESVTTGRNCYVRR